MANVNKVILIGNLTRDVEVRYTSKGTAVTDLGLAVNRQWTDDQGQRHEEPTFVDITLWGRQAEIAGQYLSKGRSVYIEGRLQMDSWDDRETGQKRSKLKIVGEVMQFLGGRDDSGGGSGGGGGGNQGSGGNYPQGRGQQEYGYGGGSGAGGSSYGGGQGAQGGQGGGGGGRPQSGGNGGGAGAGDQQRYSQEPPPQEPNFEEEDDDIPF